jgi:hypothetical protein
MIELTPEKLRDFALCSRLYEHKHVQHLVERKPKSARDRLVDEFEDAMTKTIKWFYFELMSDKVPSFRNLQWKWEKLWFKGATVEEVMREVTDPGKNKHRYNTEAQTILSNFYETNKGGADVLMINERYVVPITPDTKAIGSIDLVVREGNFIVIKHLSTKGPGYWKPGTMGWHKMILDSMAFRYRTDKIENKVSVEMLRDGRRQDFVISSAEVNEITGLSDELANCNSWRPSRGCYWCKSCSFNSECYAE